jgi:hypothetical protein
MDEVRLVKRGLVASLRENIERNIERYLNGNFHDILSVDYVIPVKGVSVDLELLQKLCPNSGGHVDVENAKIVHAAISGLTRYLARDERLWVWFTHGPCIDYVRKRWITGVSVDDRIKQIRDHFFASGNRGFERNNALACLWWWAQIASQYRKAPLDEVLEVFLHQTDVRAAIIERPTATQPAFNSIMEVLIEQFKSDPERVFFKRRKSQGLYQKWLMEINRYAGVRMYEAFPESENTNLFRRLAAQVVAEGKLEQVG